MRTITIDKTLEELKDVKVLVETDEGVYEELEMIEFRKGLVKFSNGKWVPEDDVEIIDIFFRN